MGPVPPPVGPSQTREQWRAWKAQARAQRAVYRTQSVLLRNQLRERSRTLRRGSILGPLLLIALGLVLLLARLGRLPPELVWHLYAQWWPLLLVLGGVVLLAEWGLDQLTPVGRMGYVRRSLGGGTVLLLIVLASGGAFAHGALRGHELLMQNFTFDPAALDGLFGEKQENTSRIDERVPPGSRIVVVNPRGDVRITGDSQDGLLHADVNTSVYGLSSEEIRSRLNSLKPQVHLVDGTLTLEVQQVTTGSADLTITVPADIPVAVSASRGAVNVTALHAPLTLTALHGDVDVSAIGGNVTARVNSSSDSFSAHDIHGDLTLKGHAEDLNVADVTGQTSLQGEFFGDTHLEHLHGATIFETSRTQFHTGAIADQVDISNGANMTGSQLSGPTTLRTRSRNVSFDQVNGDINLNDRDGTVELTVVSPMSNVSITNRDGAVTLNLPVHSGMTLQADTQDGRIQNNLELTPLTEADHTRLRGKLGDGKAQVDVKTSNADIEIHSGPGSQPGTEDRK